MAVTYDQVQRTIRNMENAANQPGATMCAVCGSPTEFHGAPHNIPDHPQDKWRLVVLFGKTYRWFEENGRYSLRPVLR